MLIELFEHFHPLTCQRLARRGFLLGAMLLATFALPGFARADSPAPTRAPSLPAVIDLTPYYRKVFRDPAGADSTYKGLTGLKTIDGLPFIIGGEIALYGKSAAERNTTLPVDIAGIKIGCKFDELHLIHSATWREYYGCPIAVIRLHYANGTTCDFPIRDGFHLNDWNRLLTENDEPLADPDTKVIWRGPGIVKGTGRLFKTVLHNPFPGLVVDSMELASTLSNMSYTLVAATIARSDPTRDLTPPIPLEPSRNFDGALTLHVVDAATGKPLAGAEINTAWVIQDVSLVGDPVVTAADGTAVVKFPKLATKDLRVQVVKDGYLTCNDNWMHGWDGATAPARITCRLTAGQDDGTTPPDLGDSKNQVPDEGRLYRAVVYRQISPAPPKLVPKPYQFIADLRNSPLNCKGSLALPPGATTSPVNSLTIIEPANLAGTRYISAQAFGAKSDLLANFPDGNYSFKIGRTYPCGVTTSYTVPAILAGSVAPPTPAPFITHGTWRAGSLLLRPASAVIRYKPISGTTVAWSLIGKNSCADGGTVPTDGTLDLTGLLQPGQTYQAQLRFTTPDNSVTVADPDAPPGENNFAYTYSTLSATLLQFAITTAAQ